jgi:hypothetical protein
VTPATYYRCLAYLEAYISIAAPGKRPDELEEEMAKMNSRRRGSSWVWGSAFMLLMLTSISVTAAAGQDPAKTYEKFLGNYEFDLGDMGGVKVFEFYVKDGAFWIEYGFTSPGELKAEENSTDQFTFTDPDDGLIKVTFQKDAEGQYSKCRVVAESLSLDIVGTKLK